MFEARIFTKEQDAVGKVSKAKPHLTRLSLSVQIKELGKKASSTIKDKLTNRKGGPSKNGKKKKQKVDLEGGDSLLADSDGEDGNEDADSRHEVDILKTGSSSDDVVNKN